MTTPGILMSMSPLLNLLCCKVVPLILGIIMHSSMSVDQNFLSLCMVGMLEVLQIEKANTYLLYISIQIEMNCCFPRIGRGLM